VNFDNIKVGPCPIDHTKICRYRIDAPPNDYMLDSQEHVKEVWDLMKYFALKDFRKNNNNYLDYVEQESNKLARFLPENFPTFA